MDEKLFSIEEAAAILRIPKNTVRRFINEGRIRAFKVDQHGQRYVGPYGKYVIRESDMPQARPEPKVKRNRPKHRAKGSVGARAFWIDSALTEATDNLNE